MERNSFKGVLFTFCSSVNITRLFFPYALIIKLIAHRLGGHMCILEQKENDPNVWRITRVYMSRNSFISGWICRWRGSNYNDVNDAIATPVAESMKKSSHPRCAVRVVWCLFLTFMFDPDCFDDSTPLVLFI